MKAGGTFIALKMTKEKDITNKVVAEINGYQIVRSEARKYDKWTGSFSGQTKVYYDVCDGIDLLESFKTLKEAKRFCKA